MGRHKDGEKKCSRQKMPVKEKKRLPGPDAGNSILGKIQADIKAWVKEKADSLQRMDMKRLLLLNFPYLAAVYVFDKAAWLYRHCLGESMAEKAGVLFMNFSVAFENPFPSLHPRDLFTGAAGAALVKAAVYMKGKNAKKFRHGEEYGSARWGTAKDIAPFIDPVFDNNILLTQTERLTMDSRPKQPKYARNKNVVVIGGSGSGKTRFYVKPQLMQMPRNVSFVVTDPNGLVC